jgi:hypothetical protein
MPANIIDVMESVRCLSRACGLERVYYPFRNVFSSYSDFETLRTGY